VLQADHEGDAGFVPPELEPDAIQAHPRFAEAMRASAQAMVELHSRSRFLGWFLSDRALAILAHAAVALDSDARDDDPRTGLTPSRFKAFCVENGLCSEGRATAVLAFMRLSGHLEAQGHPADRRITRLTPSGKLLETMRSRLRAQLGCAAMICPEVAPAIERLGSRDFERGLGVEFVRRFTFGIRLVDQASSLRLFTERDVGVLALFALALQGDPADPFPSDKPLPLSIAALARRFKVSRTHILRLVRDAEAAGLVARLGDKGDRLLIQPQLRDDTRRLFAAMFRLVALCAWPLVVDARR
jgi:AraC-like DNA-binding protein